MKPQDSLTRESKQITGLWDFCFDSEDCGVEERWFASRLKQSRRMSISNSFNDIFTEQELHDYVGSVWYQKEVMVPHGWNGRRISLYFESVTHQAMVWVNETLVASHVGGYTPFEADLTDLVTSGEIIRLTIRVCNILTMQTIPPGAVAETAAGKRQKYWHDFFNYAGIHRPIWFVMIPQAYIKDVTIVTDFKGSDGYVSYRIETSADVPGQTACPHDIQVVICDRDGCEVACGSGRSGTLTIPNVTLWKPGKAYLYTAKCYIGSPEEPVDEYKVRFGVRTVRVDGYRFLINEEPFYFTGFGKHEDIQVIGKGHNDANMIHDFELLRWIGANSFRTSHYPYSEDVMDYADEQGIVIIDETPAVGLRLSNDSLFPGIKFDNTFGPDTINEETQEVHAQAIRELIARDKNHPCVVMWSVANEPAAHQDGADDYFGPLFELARTLDPTRPLGYANECATQPSICKVSQFSDVLMLNRYYGWYTQPNNLPEAEKKLRDELDEWTAMGKPIIFTEYGTDTITGFHNVVPSMWTEEYQIQFLELYHRIFDSYDSVVGEQVWNFADFATEQGFKRVGGNRKGVFNRDRSPKASAFYLKKRWSEC